MKKIALFVAVGVFSLLLAVVILGNQAHAEDNDHGSSSITSMGLGQMKIDNEGLKLGDTQPSVSVRPNGDFQITGVVVNAVDVTGGTITGTLFGITRTVNVSGAAIMGGGRTSISLADIKAGDMLTASGNFSAATKTAKILRINDASYKKNTEASNIQNRIQELLNLVAKLQAQLQSLQH